MDLSFSSPPDGVVEKVLRRAEVAKMARKMQDRLALASYKAQNGQENLSFRDVEAHLDAALRQKRALARLDTSSSCSSSSSDLNPHSLALASSPPHGPLYSDTVRASSIVQTPHKRRYLQADYAEMELPNPKRSRSHSMAPPLPKNASASWKANLNLPQSSPIQPPKKTHFSTSHGPNISFASEISTIPDSPTFGHVSEEETDGLHASYRSHRPSIPSSPPRTPPSSHRRSKSGGNGEEGADLLLYLATSPSPAHPGHRSSRSVAPSTPPTRDYGSFTATMNTPGLLGLATPGQNFNFAEFCNVTPSPAQGAFGSHTPHIAKTPLAAKDARKKLNFDSLAPPGSPPVSNVGRGVNRDALGLELGGELGN